MLALLTGFSNALDLVGLIREKDYSGTLRMRTRAHSSRGVTRGRHLLALYSRYKVVDCFTASFREYFQTIETRHHNHILTPSLDHLFFHDASRKRGETTVEGIMTKGQFKDVRGADGS